MSSAERPPDVEKPHFFSNTRDMMLWQFSEHGFYRAAGGHRDAPMGLCTALVVGPEHHDEIGEYFEDELKALDIRDLDVFVGDFLMIELPDGQVTVEECADRDELDAAFSIKQAEYKAWKEDQE